MSLQGDLQHTTFEHPKDCNVKIAKKVGDYLLNGEGEYKYLFIKGMWYVVEGLCDVDRVTPFRRPILVTKAIEIGFW